MAIGIGSIGGGGGGGISRRGGGGGPNQNQQQAAIQQLIQTLQQQQQGGSGSGGDPGQASANSDLLSQLQSLPTSGRLTGGQQQNLLSALDSAQGAGGNQNLDGAIGDLMDQIQGRPTQGRPPQGTPQTQQVAPTTPSQPQQFPGINTQDRVNLSAPDTSPRVPVPNLKAAFG